MPTSADPATLVVVDTNVLLAATDRSRATHAAAVDFLERDERSLALTPQVVREYLAVATRPVEADGLDMRAADAVLNVEGFLDGMRLLSEGASSTRRLLGLVGTRPVAGRQVHDANVVAVALAHRAGAIVTDDARHFTRFADLIDIERLRQAPGWPPPPRLGSCTARPLACRRKEGHDRER